MLSNSQNLRDIFLEAIERHPPERRLEFIRTTCGEDEDLRIKLEQLLEAYDPDSQFMDASAASLLSVSGPDRFEEPLNEPIADRYELLEELGVGGMGVVFLAAQIAPVQRRVALKMIRAELNYRAAIVQFEAERQVLAMLDHSGIPKVLDGGATKSGRPFYVMEFVDGVPITEFCDRHCMSLGDRIRVLITVCDAVQHAHQKGIIHRDLKPNNILIEVRNGHPVARVIDFGIAKILELPFSQDTGTFIRNEFAGTPKYMSPEQFGEDDSDVDTRSDVYSLGVILYELLTGDTLLRSEDIRKANREQLSAMIREAVIDTPSVRINELDKSTLQIVAERRGAKPESLRSRLLGELDCIAVKTVAKNRNLRYQSAESLADDLKRFLGNDIVRAVPLTGLYQFRKMAYRYRVLLGFLVTAGCSLVIMAVFSLWQASQAKSARLAAEGHYADALREKARFRELAWRTGMREACSNWEERRYAEAEFSLARLERDDHDATNLAEWRLLRHELDQSYQRILRINAPLHEVRGIPHTNKVVAAGGDGNLYVADGATFEIIATISTGIPSLHALAVSDDGQFLATGGAPDPVSDLAVPMLFSLASGEKIKELPGQFTTIESLEFSGDGTQIACGARYENVQIINISTCEIEELPADLRNSWLCRTDDGQQIFAQCGSESVCAMAFAPPFTHQILEADSTSRIISAVWIPNTSQLLAMSWDRNFLPVRDVRTNRAVCRLGDVSMTECMAYSPDSLSLFAGLPSGDIVCWDIDSVLKSESMDSVNLNHDDASNAKPEKEPLVQPKFRIHVSDTPITSLSSRDDWIFAATYGGELLAIRHQRDVPDHYAADQHSESTPAIGALSTNAGGLAMQGKDRVLRHTRLSDSTTRELNCLDLWPSEEPGAAALTLNADDRMVALAISPSENAAACSCLKSGVHLLTEERSQVLTQFDRMMDHKENDVTRIVAFSSDSKQLACSAEDMVYVASLNTSGTGAQEFKLPGLSNCLTWSPDGMNILVGGDFEYLTILDLRDNSVARGFQCGSFTESVIFSNDGSSVITGDTEGVVRFWHRDGELRKSIQVHRAPVVNLALSYDGRIGASVDVNGNVAFWYVGSGDEIGTIINSSSMSDWDPKVRPMVGFTRNDTAFRLMTYTAEGGVQLRSWDLRPQ